jgi:hypothetical protein
VLEVSGGRLYIDLDIDSNETARAVSEDFGERLFPGVWKREQGRQIGGKADKSGRVRSKTGLPPDQAAIIGAVPGRRAGRGDFSSLCFRGGFVLSIYSLDTTRRRGRLIR